MESNISKILKYKNWGMSLTPANYKPDDKPKDKKPVAVKNGDGKYKWNVRAGKTWSDDELVAALETKRLAVYHNPGKYNAPGQQFFDAESDDKTFKVNKYFNCFPETYKKKKKVNDVAVATHKLYKLPKNHKVKQYGYDDPIEGKKVELLCSGISVIDGLDRLVMDSREPSEADPAYIKQCLQLSTFLAELESYWPKEGSRDLAHFELAGALAKHTDLPLSIKKKFITRFLEITNDDEVDNRLNKYAAQEEAFKNNPDIVVGIDTLAKRLGGNFKSFDELKIEVEEEEKEEQSIEYPLIDASMFSNIEYKKPEFLLEPLYTAQSTNQIFGPPESGKSIVAQSQMLAIASGNDWLDYKCIKSMPTLYVEGELPGFELRDRRDTMLNDYWEKNKSFKPEWSFTLCRDDLEMAGLKYGFEPIGVSRLSAADQIDYGRKGRDLIWDTVERIKKITAQDQVFLTLDNISALADIDENRASDWTPILQWTNTLKARGIPNLHVHHANKVGSSSGSSAKERMLDTQIMVEKLEEKNRFIMPGKKNVQARISFKKARNFGGGMWDKPFLLTMNESGLFCKYPNLTQAHFMIVKLWKEGDRDVDNLRAHPDVKLGKSTCYRYIDTLKEHKLISDKDPKPKEVF